MQTRIFFASLLIGSALAGTAIAETVEVNGQVEVMPSQVDRPKRGTTMDEVEKRFGAPANRHPTVGAPPITRWDYGNFSVFFEKDRVIDAVVTSG
jgi:hypothetical protein